MLKSKKIQGFTILEVVIYITIFAGILTVAIFFAWDIIGGQTKTFVITEVNQNSRFILERVARDIRQANTLNSISSSELSFDTLMGDTIIYTIANDSISRKFNLEEAVDLNNSTVSISGVWSDLSTNQAVTIGLDMTVESSSDSEHSDWQASLSTANSYDLILAQ